MKTSNELCKPVYYGIASKAIPTDTVSYSLYHVWVPYIVWTHIECLGKAMTWGVLHLCMGGEGSPNCEPVSDKRKFEFLVSNCSTCCREYLKIFTIETTTANTFPM